MPISYQDACRVLEYNPETGNLFWKSRPRDFFDRQQDHLGWNRKYAGKLAGYFSANEAGYRRITVRVFCKHEFAHHLAWLLYYKEWPEIGIDHKNRDGYDNRICNLRLATSLENQRNASMHITNTSGHAGVNWDRRRNKWMARISVKCKTVSLGRFDAIEDAIKARKEAEKKYGFSADSGKIAPYREVR